MNELSCMRHPTCRSCINVKTRQDRCHKAWYVFIVWWDSTPQRSIPSVVLWDRYSPIPEMQITSGKWKDFSPYWPPLKVNNNKENIYIQSRMQNRWKGGLKYIFNNEQIGEWKALSNSKWYNNSKVLESYSEDVKTQTHHHELVIHREWMVENLDVTYKSTIFKPVPIPAWFSMQPVWCEQLKKQRWAVTYL